MSEKTKSERVYGRILEALSMTYQLELQRAVRAEQQALVEASYSRHRGRARSASSNASDAARDFYADDVLEMLRGPEAPLEADDVFFHRRKPTVWAICRKLREAGVTAEDLERHDGAEEVSRG